MIIGEMLLALSLCYLSIWMGVIGGNSVICDSPVDQVTIIFSFDQEF